VRVVLVADRRKCLEMLVNVGLVRDGARVQLFTSTMREERYLLLQVLDVLDVRGQQRHLVILTT
jgi:hypothetical protein